MAALANSRLSLACSSTRAARAFARASGLHQATRRHVTVLQRSHTMQAKAMLGGGGQEDKKKILREEEPEEYWTSAGERKGSNPLADPLAIIGILAIFFPFILLLLAVGTGYIDLSVYRY